MTYLFIVQEQIFIKEVGKSYLSSNLGQNIVCAKLPILTKLFGSNFCKNIIQPKPYFKVFNFTLVLWIYSVSGV